jgi:hypothetical protein
MRGCMHLGLTKVRREGWMIYLYGVLQYLNNRFAPIIREALYQLDIISMPLVHNDLLAKTPKEVLSYKIVWYSFILSFSGGLHGKSSDKCN